LTWEGRRVVAFGASRKLRSAKGRLMSNDLQLRSFFFTKKRLTGVYTISRGCERLEVFLVGAHHERQRLGKGRASL
jgi:hypothetical protein